VFLGGSCRALLNWVAYAFAVGNPGGYAWTDIQLDGEVRDETDLLQTKRIPKDCFFEIPPEVLQLDEFAGNVVLGGVVRAEESADALRQLSDFLRLPSHAQKVISGLPLEGPPAVLVLSNAQRIAALYSWKTVAPALRSILQSGASLLVTWAEAPTAARLEFETILHLKGDDPSSWKDTLLRVERASSSGPFRTGAELRLSDCPDVAAVLEQAL
jgi:hypothetical protein